MSLKSKKILLAISGGISAYKINYLIRSFIKKGAEIQVLLTPYAKNFVTPLTLSTLSKRPVYSDFYNKDGVWNNHIDFALWADILLVAPCTANTLSKMVNGICDSLVIATYLSAKCPVYIAPAMDLDMYRHPSIRYNLDLARKYGHTIIPVEQGELASGLCGKGRLAEPEIILKYIESYFESLSELPSKVLDKKKVLVTAGPTYEAIDAVRFIGNNSSGKMGFSIAQEAANRGAKVVLISGPTTLNISHSNIELKKIVSAKDMFKEVFKYYETVDIAVMSAAVADYTPEFPSQEKLKKREDEMVVKLIKTPDILMEMGKKKNGQYLVGFALETQNEEQNAIQKLKNKNLDMIVLNSLRDKDAGFHVDTNKVKIITPFQKEEYNLKSKEKIAKDIWNFIEKNM